MGVADQGDLQIRGMIDLRLAFAGLDGTRVLRVFRFRLLRGGWSRPPLVILGAPALGAPPLGIGHRPTLQGHFLPGLDLTVERLEADAVAAKLLSIAAVFSYDAAPCDAIGGRGPKELGGGGETGARAPDVSEAGPPL